MRRYLIPVAVSLIFIASSPYMGLIRDGLKAALGEAFTQVVGAVVGLAGAAVLVWGVRRVRECGRQGAGLMALAVALAAAYGFVMRTGIPDVDAVERIHFLQYGLVALLFYRATMPAPLMVVVPITLLTGTLVGIGEEWLQWLVPTRVGDVRDVLLNFWALGCGLLFAVGLVPLDAAVSRPMPWRRLSLLASVVLVVFAGFLDSAHLGELNEAPSIGRFRSFFTVEELEEVSADRFRRWAADPPIDLGGPFSVQDHFLVEAGARVQRRNEAYAAGAFADAWRENALLEAYYAPMLDLRSFGSGDPHRWPAAQRDEVEAKGAGLVSGVWVSPVYQDRVHVVPTRGQLWLGTGAIAVLLLGAAAFKRRAADAGSG
jgi:hypothetical protein